MRMPSRSRTARRLGLAVAAAGLAAAAAPALAQAYNSVDEVVVSPRLGPDGRPTTLSRTVNIADLDLRYDRDVREMQRRVRSTARRLCDELGERDTIPTVEASCVNNAVRSANYQMRVAINQSRSGPYYAYAAPPAYAGEYAPPAAAVVPAEPYELPPPPDL